ncbi:isochorismatase family protein [Rhizobium laguerreae]|uniref:isochorismatase family protein n=1 Tax=Rhizobium laguerreae TaxID=1076926 RepID=UPI001C9021F5|nr:isochorismatase family protein [Rhizobium laguerreae]MBY3314454.1 isochorismatase family protein [Rhizobium laguerreae]
MARAVHAAGRSRGRRGGDSTVGPDDLHLFRAAGARTADAWQWWNCYERWPMMTADGLHRPRAVTGGLASPARVFGKMIYSPPASGELHRTLLADEVRTLVLTGGETEACVLAAALDIIDLGCKVMG